MKVATTIFFLICYALLYNLFVQSEGDYLTNTEWLVMFVVTFGLLYLWAISMKNIGESEKKSRANKKPYPEEVQKIESYSTMEETKSDINLMKSGTQYLREGDFENAIQAFKKILQHKIGYHYAYLFLIDAYLKNSNLEDAVDIINKINVEQMKGNLILQKSEQEMFNALKFKRFEIEDEMREK